MNALVKPVAHPFRGTWPVVLKRLRYSQTTEGRMLILISMSMLALGLGIGLQLLVGNVVVAPSLVYELQGRNAAFWFQMVLILIMSVLLACVFFVPKNPYDSYRYQFEAWTPLDTVSLREKFGLYFHNSWLKVIQEYKTKDGWQVLEARGMGIHVSLIWREELNALQQPRLHLLVAMTPHVKQSAVWELQAFCRTLGLELIQQDIAAMRQYCPEGPLTRPSISGIRVD